jgi:hypothetical protein
MKMPDLISIGRRSVDHCGAQVGDWLTDMRGFNKYIVGSLTKIIRRPDLPGLKSASKRRSTMIGIGFTVVSTDNPDCYCINRPLMGNVRLVFGQI